MLFKNIEELSLNAWPALETFVHRGWILRLADGYTKRSNSVSAIYADNAADVDSQIAYCEQVYGSAGLDPIFKITPFVPEELDGILDAKGYKIVEPSNVMVLDSLDAVAEPVRQGIVVEERLTANWLDVLGEFGALSETNKQITRKMLSHTNLQMGFFILHDHSVPVACGLGVLEGQYVGLYDIVTAKPFRNRGYGEQLLLHLLQWAKANGATGSYLQVVQQNMPARRLYDKLGYKEIYTYWYRHSTWGI